MPHREANVRPEVFELKNEEALLMSVIYDSPFYFHIGVVDAMDLSKSGLKRFVSAKADMLLTMHVVDFYFYMKEEGDKTLSKFTITCDQHPKG